MTLSVIVPTHNRSDALDKTLDCLRQQVFNQLWEVVVVNSSCTDNTDEVVAKQAKDFPVTLTLIHQTRPGASAARNAGAKVAKGIYLIFVDNDILTQPDFIQRHYDNLNKLNGCWFVGHVENLPEQQNTVFGKFRKSLEALPFTELTPIGGITGQNTSMLREQFFMLGGFDENFHTASGEDRELAIRAINAGIKIYLDPATRVIHNDWAGSSIRDYCKRQRLYTQTEPFFWKKYGNKTPRLRMVRENLPPLLKQDGVRLYCWKHLKHILGSKPGQAIIIKTSEIIEKVFPQPFILWRLYKLAIAGAIYKGFNEGLDLFSVEQRIL